MARGRIRRVEVDMGPGIAGAFVALALTAGVGSFAWAEGPCTHEGKEYPEGAMVERCATPKCIQASVVVPVFRCKAGQWECAKHCGTVKNAQDGGAPSVDKSEEEQVPGIGKSGPAVAPRPVQAVKAKAKPKKAKAQVSGGKNWDGIPCESAMLMPCRSGYRATNQWKGKECTIRCVPMGK